jgi:ABC-type amino acid transport substrate-binding protein
MTMLSRRQALTMLGTASAAVALAPTIALTGRKAMVCNWNASFPPYSMQRDGVMTGILVDCLDELLGRRMGFALHHKGYDWPEAQTLVGEGKGDTLCTNPTDARKQYLLFAEEPLVESLPSIFCAADNPRLAEINAVATLKDLQSLRQVDYKGNGWARKTFPADHPILYVDTLNQALDMVARNEADVFVGNGLAAMYAIGQAGLKGRIRARELPVGEPSSFHFGLRADYPDAAAIMARFANVQDEAMDQGVTRKIILGYI